MPIQGIIFTAIDTDADNIESWNRWYDLEHLPPNIALPEIAHGRRYVAPVELHDIRLPVAEMHPGFEDGKGVNVTIYLTSDHPVAAIQSMTETRDVLVDAGRMDNAGARTVRTGDAMVFEWAVADPALKLDDQDVPWVAHTGLRVVLWRATQDNETTTTQPVADAAVTTVGCSGVMSVRSKFFDGLHGDFYYLEGSSSEATKALRDAAPYPDGIDVVLDAPFDAVVAFDYSFADRIRGTRLPQALDADEVL